MKDSPASSALRTVGDEPPERVMGVTVVPGVLAAPNTFCRWKNNTAITMITNATGVVHLRIVSIVVAIMLITMSSLHCLLPTASSGSQADT